MGFLDFIPSKEEEQEEQKKEEETITELGENQIEQVKEPDTPVITLDETLITGSQVCKMLGISDETLHRWVKLGKVKAYKIPSVVYQSSNALSNTRGKRYKLSEVQALVKAI